MVNCNKSSSPISESVIRPATKEKYSIPKINGPSDITIATYKIFFALTAIPTLPFMQNISSNTKIKHVIIAVSRGAKFAYPNGVKSKYEKVSLIVSVGEVAKIHTAPYGKISKISVITGSNKYKNLFFIGQPPLLN